MRKQIIYLFIFLLTGLSCAPLDKENPYEEQLNDFQLSVKMPVGFENHSVAGFEMLIEEMNTGSSYRTMTDDKGSVSMRLPGGLYRVTVHGKVFTDVFNGTADKLPLTSAGIQMNLPLVHSKAGMIVIKELYNGGCKKAPIEGDYQSDQYMILHNNDYQVQYLDSLCIGSLSPFNATGANYFVSKDPETGESIFPDFLPVAQAVWQIGGDGDDFPLQPGEDAVICFRGAIDHTIQYPLSVNLNKEGYFVCYDIAQFDNTLYHPAPGDKISSDRIISVLIKTGRGSAYTLSVSSPAVLIWKSKGIAMGDFVQVPDNLTFVPGSIDKVVKVPYDWAYDALEVFNAQSSINSKRFPPALDASYVLQTDSFLGRSLMRYVDEEESAKAGYEVLKDSNNSGKDFYESEKQSLHE